MANLEKAMEALAQILIVIGIIGITIYGSITYTNWETINILEKRGDNEEAGIAYVTEDVPLYTLMAVEFLAVLILLCGGCFGIYAKKNSNTRAPILLFVGVAFIIYGITGTWRAVTIWGEGEGQCNYFGDNDYLKACPATRHERLKVDGGWNEDISNEANTWNISKKEPVQKSDCVFWFWDNTFPMDSMVGAGSPLTGNQQIALEQEMIKNMNWAGKASYGFYDADDTCETDFMGATDCIQDGRTVFKALEDDPDTVTNLGITISKKLGSIPKPDISFCYYWGCHHLCNEDRYYVNRLLLYISLTMAAATLGASFLAGSYASQQWKKSKEAKEEEKAPDAEEDSNEEAGLYRKINVGYDAPDSWKPMPIRIVNRSKGRELRF